MMSKFKEQTLLVTGASGHFGRIAIDELLAKGATMLSPAHAIRPSWQSSPQRGVTVRALDFDDAASLPAPLPASIGSCSISTDAVGKRVDQQRAAIKAAEAAGVKHVVYTSAPTPRPNIGGGVSPEHYWTEQAWPRPAWTGRRCATISMPR